MEHDKEGLFRKRVYELVAKIPYGRVMTYGQIALLVGMPRAAREVGWIAHTGPSQLPWQRVVNRFGGLAKGYPGAQLGHKAEIEKEGIEVNQELTTDLQKYQWWPDEQTRKELQLPDEVAHEINQKISFSRERLSRENRRS